MNQTQVLMNNSYLVNSLTYLSLIALFNNVIY